eukprot:gb/GFBE01073087.1/.p1 GENE.gb/GFBE01073087.1/~~gb/GFBE01073087.1/.p1  ORF type:complete len:189 (+),score=54.35 gb/GFBE01073087.1/:1-567(+)
MNIRLEGDGKFWEIVQEGQKTISAFGKLGSTGKTDSQVHYELAAATRFSQGKVKEKLKKGYKECGKAKVCPAFLEPKYSNDFVEGTISEAANGSPSGWAYECEAQAACIAKRDCKGYFVSHGYCGHDTYHILVPGAETWTKGSHGGLVQSVKMKKEGAKAVTVKTTVRGGARKPSPAMKVLKKPAKKR